MRATRWWVFALAAVVTSVFFINFCNLMFACGCQSLWAGADAHCNVHHAGAGHHRCPWCQMGTVGSYTIWGTIIFTQLLVARRTERLGWIPCSLLSLTAFPLVGAVWAAGAGLYFGYWT